MDDILVVLIVVAILSMAIAYIYKSKKSGKVCIGCPNGCRSCSHGASCCGCDADTDTDNV